MYNNRSILCFRVLIHYLANSASKFKECIAEWIWVAGPFSVVKLDDFPLFSIFPQSDSSNHKIRKLLLQLHCNPNSSIHLLPIFCSWPVLNTHHSNKVKSSCDHHNAGGFFLPCHSPEIRHCGLCGSLGYNVGFGLDQALQNLMNIYKILWLF